MFHVEHEIVVQSSLWHAGTTELELPDFFSLPRLIQTINRLTSVGLLPEILDAKPIVAGWISFNFWRDSVFKPGI